MIPIITSSRSSRASTSLSIERTDKLVQSLIDLRDQNDDFPNKISKSIDAFLVKYKNQKYSTNIDLDMDERENNIFVHKEIKKRNFLNDIDGYLHADVSFFLDEKEKHIYEELDDMEFTTVKTIVESCPEFLATKQSGCLPCHHAAYYAKASSYKYLKLYIDIGVKHNIGGEESRGCLLESNGTCITLCIISDSQLFEVFRKISPPLFYIEDIQKYHLLHNAINVHYACYDLAKYFCNLDPSSVFQRNEDNQLPIHCIVENDSDGMREEDEEYIWNMTGYLIQASLSHSPSDETIGGLFAISRDYTICIIDNDQMGTENTWNLVEKALSKYKELDNMPCILHQIIRHTPQYCDEVIKRFPNSVHVQDKNNMNRLPIHVALETGMEWSLELEYLIATGHEYLKDVDPVTKCPPFLLAGMGRESSCDLRVIYDLLHKHPEHVEMMEDGSGYKYIMLEENHKKRRIE